MTTYEEYKVLMNEFIAMPQGSRLMANGMLAIGSNESNGLANRLADIEEAYPEYEERLYNESVK